jgi:hypothetical protein
MTGTGRTYTIKVHYHLLGEGFDGGFSIDSGAAIWSFTSAISFSMVRITGEE